MNTTTKSPSPRQTFALFCATGMDWRNRNLDQATVSAMLDKVMGKKLPKPQALAICEAVVNGQPVEDVATPPTPEEIYAEAHAAGLAAANQCVPVPMFVQGYKEPIMGGVCGFAWVKIRPATGAFVNYLKKQGIGHKGYGGGYHMWISDFNQSMTLKEAYGAAFASVLCDHGLNAFVQSRMD